MTSLPPIPVRGVNHVGIRVRDAAASEAFYSLFGFEVIARHDGAKVVIVREPGGVEINFIVNAAAAEAHNVLMDEAIKHPGYTHVALGVADMEATVRGLGEAGVAISEGPVRLGEGLSVFVRDPDRNVIELRETGP